MSTSGTGVSREDEWLYRHFEQRLQDLARAVEVASEEREKSAQALSTSLASQIEAGDHALLLHIHAQKQEVDALRHSNHQQFEASKEAITKAETATEKRFESVNEFRAQLNDLIRNLATKEVVERIEGTIDEKFDVLNKRAESNASRITEIEARTGGGADQKFEFRQSASAVKSTIAIGISAVVAGISLVGLVVTVILATGT